MTGILYLLTCLLAIAAARVGGHDLSAAAVARRDAHAIRARGAMSKCSQKLKARELVEHRLARRAQLLGAHLAERRLQARAAGATDYPAQHPEDGYYPPPVVTNYSSSCILTPEILTGPYYVQGELIRHDISDGKTGVDLLLDFQFIDVNTCIPVPQAMVDIWHCNSTGTYSDVDAENTVGESFCRGLQPTDDNGVMHMKTTFPGWYLGRATHIHLALHTDGVINHERHIYQGGTTHHVGQVFFPEEILRRIDNVGTYATNPLLRITNEQDPFFPKGNDAINAIADVQMLGRDGLLAFIFIGVDLNANRTEALINPPPITGVSPPLSATRTLVPPSPWP